MNRLVIAISSPDPDLSDARVRIYNNVEGNWVKLGDDIIEPTNEMFSSRFGKSISLSGDGKRVAVGATYNNDIYYIGGEVRVYEYLEGDWNKIGDDINGFNYAESIGYDVSLNYDGSVLAFGHTSLLVKMMIL